MSCMHMTASQLELSFMSETDKKSVQKATSELLGIILSLDLREIALHANNSLAINESHCHEKRIEEAQF